MRKKLFCLCMLNNLPEIHDSNLVAEILDNPQVMTDKEERDVRALLELLEYVQYLCLYRDVERRERFVSNEHFGRNGECPRDADPLTLSSAELMRISCQDIRLEAYTFKNAHYFVLHLMCTGKLVYFQRFRDSVTHSHPRVQGCKGILEYYLHRLPELLEQVSPEVRDIFTLEQETA